MSQLISDLTLAKLCAAIYDQSQMTSWDHYWDYHDVSFAHMVIEGVDIIVMRGSDDGTDWKRNVSVWPTLHKDLGYIHSGFYEEMDSVLEEIVKVVKPGWIITGHSLGGARARILTALAIIKKIPVSQVVTFGSPRPGFNKFAKIIQKSSVIHRSYRNGKDPVTQVPTILPFWKHPEPYIAVDGDPDDSEFLGVSDHKSANYVKGVSLLIEKK